ncbi:MAG: GDP-L-fucose synthase [Betaproteobacteria bacterium]|nr:GDP-L-fucose synthase [Betaproteobacteria bacterium]
MNKGDKIYVAGHRGLAGSALTRKLLAAGYSNLVTRTHAELELTDLAAVKEFFARERPDYVFLAAARVGGIHANNTFPADFVFQNLAIQNNVIHQAWTAGVKRLLFLGSSCIYPRDCPQPMREEYLLTGPLEPTNRPYAIAKIAGVELCWALNRQHHTRFIAAMPTNLYGPADNYDLQNSHVLPALIRKAHEAKVRGDAQLTVWGTGTPRREFLYSEDMADACILLLQLPDAKFDALINPPGTNTQPPLINIGCGNDLTVRELAETIARAVGFKGELRFDARKPDGTPRKLLDVSRMEKLGWRPKVSLADGIAVAYKDYLKTMVGNE